MDYKPVEEVTLNETAFNILKFIYDRSRPTTVKDLTDQFPIDYSKGNAYLKRYVNEGMLKELPGKGLRCVITPYGREVVAAADVGKIHIKKDLIYKPKIKATSLPQQTTPLQSNNDPIAAELIKLMAQPIALNTAINNCLDNILSLTSDLLDEYPHLETPAVSALDKHNLSLYTIIETIDQACPKESPDNAEENEQAGLDL